MIGLIKLFRDRSRILLSVFSYHSFCRKNQFTVLILKFGIEDFTDLDVLLACENIRFSSLFAAGEMSPAGEISPCLVVTYRIGSLPYSAAVNRALVDPFRQKRVEFQRVKYHLKRNIYKQASLI